MDILHLEIGYILFKFSLDNISYRTLFVFFYKYLAASFGKRPDKIIKLPFGVKSLLGDTCLHKSCFGFSQLSDMVVIILLA